MANAAIKRANCDLTCSGRKICVEAVCYVGEREFSEWSSLERRGISQMLYALDRSSGWFDFLASGFEDAISTEKCFS